MRLKATQLCTQRPPQTHCKHCCDLLYVWWNGEQVKEEMILVQKTNNDINNNEKNNKDNNVNSNTDNSKNNKKNSTNSKKNTQNKKK